MSLIDPAITQSVTCTILAGGQARRMGGGDKALLSLAGQPLLKHILKVIQPQCRAVMLNAGGDPERFSAFHLPVEEDVVAGALGPLAGVLTGLEWTAGTHPGCTHMLSLPGDAPFIPHDVLLRLWAALKKQNSPNAIACARSGGRAHPVVALWPVSLGADLRKALIEEDLRKVDLFTARYPLLQVNWDVADKSIDPFFNINHPEDLKRANNLIS